MLIHNKKLQAGAIVVRGVDVIINQFNDLPGICRHKILTAIREIHEPDGVEFMDNHIILKDFDKKSLGSISAIIEPHKSFHKEIDLDIEVHPTLAFTEIRKICFDYSVFLAGIKDRLFQVLGSYECYNAFCDEIVRSIFFLRNIEENKEYFKGRVNGIAVFLPLNQPIYSLVCFGLVPSFLTQRIYVRPPGRLHEIYKTLIDVLQIRNFFPNVFFHFGVREDFIKRTKQAVNAVIFTGNPTNGTLVRKCYSPDTLIIVNGSGHNPIVIFEDADLELAVESIIRVCLLNQGQDCAAPNAILVSHDVYAVIRAKLHERLRIINALVGPCSEKSNIIGPNTEKNYCLKIAREFARLKHACSFGGLIDITKNLIYPTVFEIPLTKYQALKEFFAPVIMLQEFTSISELDLYFHHPLYGDNAMYVSFFGNPPQTLVENLIDAGIHRKSSMLYNTDLHIYEKGVSEYGGMGKHASCIYYKGNQIPGATLPQREIHTYLINKSVKD